MSDIESQGVHESESGKLPESEPSESPWAVLYQTTPKKEIRTTPTIQELEKKKEGITGAEFELTIDKDMLLQIPIPDRSRRGGEEAAAEARRELEACLERFARLPEHLRFEPGITLIVSEENGSGKTTLGKAFMYAAQYQEHINQGHSPQDAAGLVFGYEGSNSKSSTDLERNQAGIAPAVARAIHVDNFVNGSLGLKYYDTPNIMGWLTPRGLEALDRSSFQKGEDRRSHRQTVDNALFDQLKKDKERGDKPTIMFIDEPEIGMGIRRQRDLEAEIREVMTEGSIAIIPTNSIKLYESDLPRISLDHPERGIHRPSQYPVDKPE